MRFEGIRQGPTPVLHSSLAGTWGSIEMLLDRVKLVVGCLKFGNRECADRLCPGGGRVALETPRENALRLVQTGVPFVVRHLLMPGHVECCWAGVARWLADHCPQVSVSLLTGFVPPAKAPQAPELLRCLEPEEVDRARDVARELGLVLEPNGRRQRQGQGQGQRQGQRQGFEGETIDILIDRDGRICFHQYGDTIQDVLSALTDIEFTKGS